MRKIIDFIKLLLIIISFMFLSLTGGVACLYVAFGWVYGLKYTLMGIIVLTVTIWCIIGLMGKE